MEAAELRPLRAGEAIDATFALVREQFGPLVRQTAIVMVPAYFAIWAVSMSDAQTLGNISAGSLARILVPGFAAPSISQHRIAFWVALAIGFLAWYLAVARCARPAAVGYLRGFGVELPSNGRPVRAALVAYVCGLFGLILFVVGGLIVHVVLLAAAPAAAVEGLGAFKACRRSRELMKHRLFTVLGWFLLLMLLLTFVAAVTSTLVLGLFVAGDLSNAYAFVTAQVILQLAAALVTMPIFASFATIVYFDLRIRREGFDLALSAQNVGDTAGTPTFADADRNFGAARSSLTGEPQPGAGA